MPDRPCDVPVAAVTTRPERCGLWVVAGGYESVCMKLPDHPGECLPLRSELLTMAEHWERQAQAIYDAVTAIDHDGGWPYEGPEDERPSDG